MPQIVLEHSTNVSPRVDVAELLQQVHHIVSTTGSISLVNCKSRVYVAEQFRVGDGDPGNAFVHLDVRFVEGRSLAVRQQIGEQLKAWLMDCFGDAPEQDKLQITVEVRDILLQEYFKYPQGTLTRQ